MATCHWWRKASSSAADIGTCHSRSFRCTNVPRLWKVTRMSPLLIGTRSSATARQRGDCGSRWRTAACTRRVLLAVTTNWPEGSNAPASLRS
jgi:hypothetical protein